MSPEQTATLDSSAQSSLAQTILLIEQQKALRPTTDFEAQPQTIDSDPEFGQMKAHLDKVIDSTFSKKRERQLKASFATYTAFLTADEVPLNSRRFVASPEFQEYVKKTIERSMMAPYFLRVLEIVKTADSQVLDFISRSFEPLSELDSIYRQLSRRNGDPDLAKALTRFQTVNARILRIASDESDTSDFKSFILQHPSTAFSTSSYLTLHGASEKGFPGNYYPQRQFSRLQKLVLATAPQDWETLGDYFTNTLPIITPKASTIDREVKKSKWNRAQVINNFWATIMQGFAAENEVEIYGRNTAGGWWIDRYIEGQASEEKLMAVAEYFITLRSTLLSLPPAILRNLAAQGNEIDELYEGGPHYDISSLVKSPTFPREADLIIRLCSAGMLPQEELIRKLLEKPEEIDQVMEFSKTLLPFMDYLSFGIMVRDWIVRYLEDGQLISLPKLAEALGQIRRAELEFYQKNKEKRPFVKHLETLLKEYYHTPSLPDYADPLTILLSHGILPTFKLVDYIKAHGESGLDIFQKLQAETARGGFDSSSLIQRDLEFPRFLSLTETTSAAYNRFQALEFIDGQERVATLTPQELMEAEAAAFEAARLYWFIKERVNHDRNIIVIGNQRYGDLFVVQPLEKWLQEFNRFERRVAYVRSSNTSDQTIPELFPEPAMDAFVKSLIIKAPDVVIIDGSANSFPGENPRFPKAMMGYLNWFLAFNEACDKPNNLIQSHEAIRTTEQYKSLVSYIKDRQPTQDYTISHWIPTPTNAVLIGALLMPYTPPSYEGPQVIFANPVIDPKKFPGFPLDLASHKPGFLDDPERYAKRETTLALTKLGVQKLIEGRTLEEFIALVQNRMEMTLPGMLRITDPLFHYE